MNPRTLLSWLPLAALAASVACSELPADLTRDSGSGTGLDRGAADLGCSPGSCQVPFSYESSTASQVVLRGSFDNWGAGVAMTRSGAMWTATLTLRHGTRVEYKFYVDGAWVSDPENPKTTGPYNNNYVDVVCADPCGDGGASPAPDRGTTPAPDGPVIAPDGPVGPGTFDWRDGVMYFVMTDRFFDGDSTNNKPESGVETPANWQGGDLAGVLKKLKDGYFTDLGINVLWLTSPVHTPAGKYLGKDGHYYSGYHGYWPGELTQVDSHLGDMTQLKQVVSEAHSKGIKVVLDYVMNHVHQKSSTYINNSGWFWPLQQYGTTCICGVGCSWAAPQGLSCWFDPFLPDFNFQNTTARSFSVKNAIWWIQQTGIDGCRLDAVKHIETTWLSDFRAAVKAAGLQTGKRFYLVGETFDGDRAVLKKYVNPATMLDGQFDFPLRAKLVYTILMRKGSLKDLDSFISGNVNYYGSGAIMGTFISNHDLPRAVHLAEDTPLFGEWDDGKKKAWNTGLNPPAYARPYERLAVAYAALMTLPGIPLIYYGGELGMAGGGDPDNRRLMQWSGTNSHQDKLKATIKKLVALRKKHSALRYGKPTQVWLGDDVYAYKMSHGSETLVTVLNRSDTTQTIKLTGSYSTDLLTGSAITPASLSVPARTAMILK